VTKSDAFGSNTNREEMKMLSKEQRRAFDGFYNTARNNQVLDSKTTILLHLATAMAVGCYP
jgi:hypothetical protein